MTWKLVELTSSERAVECGSCGVSMPAEEVKVRLNPVEKHDGKIFYYHHVACFMKSIAATLPTLIQRGRW